MTSKGSLRLAALLAPALLLLACSESGQVPDTDVARDHQAPEAAEAEPPPASEGEAEMQSILKRYRADLGGSQREALDEAQSAWRAYRDAECRFRASSSEGGSAWPMVVAGCREALSLERAEALQALVDCPEGDLACPRGPGAADEVPAEPASGQ